MAEGNRSRLRALWQRPNDDPGKTLLVAFAVAVLCGALVSSTAVLLRPRQQANRERVRRAEIEALVRRMPGVEEILAAEGLPEVQAHVVELASGAIVRGMDPARFDQQAAARDPQRSVALAPEQDIAEIQRRARHAKVYLVRQGGATRLIILPVHGEGYESTLRGFVALEGDGNTIVALSFFEHEETPGLGGQIDDPGWRNQWHGKRIRDARGRLRIGVAAERVAPGSDAAAHEVDAITGATVTSEGVHNLLRFWLGDDGFGPFLSQIGS